ncbi:oligoendopeptidase F [Pelosinus propionicus]|uniref:Oligopeptidase F n=1 Tax=Pelosinus propionicus DSM 13327 TaxID=1123291 RepID=A0A1I4M7U3_9FIRM|nr:oligoendopeptidase F [Pelosinus propionicus]SFL99322.1 oligoendopeptidase F [Pelosinus propionicus DSM 13327]
MSKQPHFVPFALSLMLFSTSSAMGAEVESFQIPGREEIAAEYKWHLEDLYGSDEEWQTDYNKVKKMLPKVGEYKGKLDSSGKNLLACLMLRDDITKITGKLYPYARMHQDENTADNKYQALTGKAQSLNIEVNTAIAFIEPEIVGIPAERLEKMQKQVKGLGVYSFYLQSLMQQKQHVLSPREEALLSRAGEVAAAPATIFNVLANAEVKFPSIQDERGQEVQLSEGRYSNYLRSSDRRVRQDAFDGILGSYSQYRNTLAATLNGHVKQHVFFAQAHNYKSSQEAALMPNHIPVEVYDNLVATVNRNLTPLHRYVSLKKKALGLEEIHMYDLYAPVVKDVEIRISYPEALELVKNALAPLGEDYIADFNKGISSHWIDVYENQGKRSGAYSWGVYGVHPFVFLNYNGHFSDASTLAHEMGHALHSFYSAKSQPYPTADYVIFTAETASTTNEILLIDYMLAKTADKKEKMYLLNQYLENIRTTLYRQTMFAEFEKEIHDRSEEGETLTADLMEEIYHDLNVKYFGPEMIVDKEIDIEWARIPHFYRNFYVYQYATGYSAATAFAKQLQTEGEAAQERYTNHFLKKGGSDTPIRILKNAGVDMSTPQPIEITLAKFSQLLDELEVLLAQG